VHAIEFISLREVTYLIPTAPFFKRCQQDHSIMNKERSDILNGIATGIYSEQDY
jgi:hypothetical protein